jgi:hypothetical protein
MKKFILPLLAVTALAVSAISSPAQEVNVTNSVSGQMPSFNAGLQQIYDAATSATNYGVVFGGGRSTTGQRNLAFADLAYNFNSNVGLIIGYDYLWASKHLGQPSQANLVKGGVNLQANVQPLKNFGLTNFTVTPFGFALVATGNGNVSEILGAGVKTTLYTFKGFDLGGGLMYETRTGAGFWNGKYITGFLSLSKGF